MFSSQMKIAGYDDELWGAMQAEVRRQEEHIELIASENYATPFWFSSERRCLHGTVESG